MDSTGSLIQGLSYGDFGQRYTSGWNLGLSTSQAVTINQTLTDKGYTGQESLDSVGLDDYNARLYDPSLGRFLSVDPLISHPGSTQSINPYSYVENNPLNKTDPTGEAGLRCATNPLSCNGFESASALEGTQVTEMQTSAEQLASANNLTVTLNYSNGKSIKTTLGAILGKSLGGLDSMGSKARNSAGNTNVNDGTSLSNASRSTGPGSQEAAVALGGMTSTASGNDATKGTNAKTGYDLNLLPRHKTAWSDSQKHKKDPRYYYVIGHGNRSGQMVYDYSPKGLHHRDLFAGGLAERIRSDNNFKSNPRPIHLDVCWAGRGNDPIAQKLANILRVPVFAPTRFGWINARGEYTSSNGNDNPGREKEFFPQSP